jgi:endonuclease-3 related protein
MAQDARPDDSDPGALLRRYYEQLLTSLGPQGWWPARTRFEVILGAILTQNTSWRNVELAIRQLRKNGLLNLRRLRKAGRAEIESCIRSSGFFRQKALTIHNFVSWLERSYGGSLRAMFARPAAELRQELLNLRGLGPETADAILLYAGRQPFFVADAYTRRILARHELGPDVASYAQAQEFLHRHLPPDQALFNELHALFVEVGKRWCKPETPRCQECPLEQFLPRRGRVGAFVDADFNAFGSPDRASEL